MILKKGKNKKSKKKESEDLYSIDLAPGHFKKGTKLSDISVSNLHFEQKDPGKGEKVSSSIHFPQPERELFDIEEETNEETAGITNENNPYEAYENQGTFREIIAFLQKINQKIIYWKILKVMCCLIYMVLLRIWNIGENVKNQFQILIKILM